MQPNPNPEEVRAVTQEQIEALKKCVQSKIDLFSKKGERSKLGAAAVKFVIIASSVLTPILIGWKGIDGKSIEQLVNYALISSAVGTGATALYNFFDYKDLWTQYKAARNELEVILAELDYLEASGLVNITQQQMALLFKSYVQVCADTNSFYREIRLAKDDSEVSKR
jgi:hypothetical protein